MGRDWLRGKLGPILMGEAMFSKSLIQFLLITWAVFSPCCLTWGQTMVEVMWTSPDGQYWNQIDYILCSQRWRSSIQSAKTRPGADCVSDHELLLAKFRLKSKKVGKTARPFRYDLNQIPYDYTVEVRNRFKGLDLIEYLMNYGQRFVILFRRQGSRPSPWKRNAKRQNGCLRRAYK